MRINFDFTDLNTFLAVADLGSFQRAAESLHLSQSAVTRRIQKLEESLGVSLFERTTRSLKLTLAARLFRDRAQAILDNTEEAIIAVGDDAAQFEYQRNTIITIATIQTATHAMLPEMIKVFREQGYHSRIRIMDLFANDVIDAVSNGEADFGISFMGAQEPGLEFQQLLDDPFVVAMHPDNPLCERAFVHWADLHDQAVAIPWKGTGNRMLIDNALSQGEATLEWAYQVRHSATLLALAETGVGVSILPKSAIPLQKPERVVARPLLGPEVTRVIGSVRRSGHTLTKAAGAFYGLFGLHRK